MTKRFQIQLVQLDPLVHGICCRCDPIVHVFKYQFYHIMWLSCGKHIQCTCTGSHNMYMFCKSVRSDVKIINYSDSQGTLEYRWGTSNVLAAWPNWRTLSCETKINERTTYYRWEVPPPWGTNWKNIWRGWEIILSFTFTLTSEKCSYKQQLSNFIYDLSFLFCVCQISIYCFIIELQYNHVLFLWH